MKSNIYICFLREESEVVGILNKVREQCAAINNLGIISYLIISRNKSVVLYEVKDNSLIEKQSFEYSDLAEYSNDKTSITRKLSSVVRLKEFLVFSNSIIRKLEPTSIYIRRIKPATLSLILFMKLLSKRKCKVYWEIPTYTSIKKNINLYELLTTKYIEKMVYRTVAIAADNNIVKNNYIFTTNGVNPRRIPMKDTKNTNSVVNLICMATFDYWHGYDRLIEGIKEYYSKGIPDKIIHVHMVGNGKVASLKKLSEEYNLNKFIKFHGILLDDDLNNIFNHMDLAIGNLGFHRVGVYADTSIKIREYCARGIPFVTALKDSDFPDSFNYFYKVPADESAININELLAYYEDLIKSKPNFSLDMRNYATAKLSWENKMKFIIE